jgi:hypothetical protein
MANSYFPFGFRASRHMTALGQETNKYAIDPAIVQTIAIGDPVKSDGNGGVRVAAAGDAILGFFKGAWIQTRGQYGGSQNFQSNGQIPYFKVWASGVTLPPGSSVVCLVEDDPFMTVEAQTNNTITQADIGSLVDLVAAAPDSVFGASRFAVGAPGGAASQFKIERIYEKPMRVVDANNNTTGFSLSAPGQYALVELKIMKHERGGAAMGIAV